MHLFRACLPLFLVPSALPAVQAQTGVVHIDATAQPPAPQPVQAKLGSNRNPRGETIDANSQYLTRDGKPWLPVMGEFHFSRYPADRWEEEILKMKAAGIQIISTYIIWIHHEQDQGSFNWTGQRDLHRFIELCARHGMYVYPRIGPWAHAEVRNGGLPDWVLKMGPVRQNDPRYLAAVNTFYQQIGKQLQGELWKNGGPVIGIQIENEYHESGAGKGSDHIRTLKQMAVDAGMDVPLYTVTGWDGAAIPLDQVLPVFGGYADAPWDGSDKQLPPNEVYTFRFDNRSAGSMGAIGGHGQSPSSTYAGTPFLTAEVGSGIQDTYFRRPVVTPDDIAAMAPVMLGSGANLLGYYMFHGGRNPDGNGVPLQESQLTGYPTDVPTKSYDFQAPLGEFGQPRASLLKLKLVHYFLADFGSILAPMPPHRPDVLPADPTDLTVPRVSARTLGDQGFVFFNNHVRNATMPQVDSFQVALKLPGGTVNIPAQPIHLKNDAYGIWPVNLPLGAQTLHWSTAQVFKRAVLSGKSVYFFFAIDGVPAEFAFQHDPHVAHLPAGFSRKRTSEGAIVSATRAASGSFTLGDGTTVVLLSQSQAEHIWRGDSDNMLLSSSANAYAEQSNWTLHQLGEPAFRFGTFGAGPLSGQRGISASAQAEPGDPPLFTWFRSSVAPFSEEVNVQRIAFGTPRQPLQLGPELSWRPVRIAMAPEAKDFASATAWSITVPTPRPTPASVSDLFLRVQYQGDAARLFHQGDLIDDNFWNGSPWEIGLHETLAWPPSAQQWTLRILPLPAGAPLYIERRPATPDGTPAMPAVLDSVSLIPEYQLHITIAPKK